VYTPTHARADGESYLQLLWRALEVISVMIDNEDAAGKANKSGKQADLSPLQNCLISIVSKTRVGGDDDEDDINLDDNRHGIDPSLCLLYAYSSSSSITRTHTHTRAQHITGSCPR
jgi:hypothetical protein